MDKNVSSVPSGVMDASYARGRREAQHLNWRYRARAFEAVKAYRELKPGGAEHRVLDLGAAEGLTLLETRRLLDERGDYIGIELSDSLLAEAPPMPKNARLVKGDVTSLPDSIPAASFDLVTALAVLEHLSSPSSCVAEAYRALVPGGVLVATCPNPVWDEIAGHLGMVADEHHEEHMTPKRMVQAFEAQGFEAVVYRPFMWAPVGVMPYLKVQVPLETSHRIDSLVRGIRLANFTFVNQIVYGRKPRSVS